jgi:hypothetical protein
MANILIITIIRTLTMFFFTIIRTINKVIINLIMIIVQILPIQLPPNNYHQMRTKINLILITNMLHPTTKLKIKKVLTIY